MDDHMENEPQSIEAELARLADGSLSPGREAELRAEVERSPSLARGLAEQESVVSLLRAADAPAPASLHRQVEAMVASASRPKRPRLNLRFLVPATAAMAAIVAVVVVLSAGGSTAGPSLPQTAQLALAPATSPAPPPDTTNRVDLRLAVDGVPFPNWARTVGWRALGSRADTIGGRRIATVYYGTRGRYRVGYSIVSGTPVPVVSGHSVNWHGVRYVLGSHGSLRLVTWLRSGHTCVIAGPGVGYRTLLGLAEAA